MMKPEHRMTESDISTEKRMEKAVSVIIPTYDRLPFLTKAVESVKAQSYNGYELIVVDDGSRDGTPEWVKSLGRDIIYIRQANRGPAAARNAGIKAARTDLFAFLDSDDRWRRDKLSIQLGEMGKRPEYLLSHTQEVWHKQGKVLPQRGKHRKYHGRIFERCLPLCSVSMSTVIARRELFERIGLFDEKLPCCEDYDFWLRASVGHRFLLVDRALTFNDGGREDQVSFIHRRGMDKFRIRSLVAVLSDPCLTVEQRKTAREELQRKCRIYGEGCLKWGKKEEGMRCLELADRHSRDG